MYAKKHLGLSGILYQSCLPPKSYICDFSQSNQAILISLIYDDEPHVFYLILLKWIWNVKSSCQNFKKSFQKSTYTKYGLHGVDLFGTTWKMSSIDWLVIRKCFDFSLNKIGDKYSFTVFNHEKPIDWSNQYYKITFGQWLSELTQNFSLQSLTDL